MFGCSEYITTLPHWQAVRRFLPTHGCGGYRAFLSGVRAKNPEFRARWEQAINGPLPPDNDPQTPP
jgi:hypothetical protein